MINRNGYDNALSHALAPAEAIGTPQAAIDAANESIKNGIIKTDFNWYLPQI